MDFVAFPRNKELKERAAEMRKNMTPQESRLWYDYLRNYPVRFNRQYIIGSYIVDFICVKANLVIEIDGSQHLDKDAKEYDQARTAFLNGLDIKVIRFSNSDIDANFTTVCRSIDEEVSSNLR